MREREVTKVMALFFNQSVKDATQNLEVSTESGLTSEEVKKRVEQYGQNRLVGGKEKSILQMMFE